MSFVAIAPGKMGRFPTDAIHYVKVAIVMRL